MKTLELKIQPTLQQQQVLLKQNAADLTWLWNQGLELLIEYHNFEYYEWLTKKAAEVGVSLDGIDTCYLKLSKYSAWSLPVAPTKERMEKLLGNWLKDQHYKYFGLGGHSCQIAFIKDGEYIPVERRMLPTEPRLRKIGKTADSIYKTLGGYLTKTRCNEIRKSKDLSPMQALTAYMKGLLNRLATSWAAYTDAKRRDSHLPKWKKEPVASFSCISPENISIKSDRLHIPAIKSGIKFVNKNHQRIPDKYEIRSVVIKQEPSGWYACLTIASPLEVELREKKAEFKKTKDDEIKLATKAEIKQLETALFVQSRSEAGIKPSDKSVGIDPGVKAMIATDGGSLILSPRALKQKLKVLKRLQRKQSRQKIDGKNFKKTSAKIAKVHEKIRRNRSAYHHKVSTYLVREYEAIAWENTPHKNLTRTPKPKVRADGKGYERNGAKAKAGLNEALLDVGLGSLRQKTKDKMESLRGQDSIILTNPYNSSRDCHYCGVEGYRPTQSDFYCVNPQCRLHGNLQQADVNAARNHLLNSEFLASGRYRLWNWYQQKIEGCTPLVSGKLKPDGETLSSGTNGVDTPLVNPNTPFGVGEQSLGMKQGSTPSPEYGDLLPIVRELGDVISPDVAQSTSSPFTPTVLSNNPLPSTRAPDTVSISANTQLSGDGRKKKRKRSAQSDDQTFVQLTLWDTAVPKGFEETG